MGRQLQLEQSDIIIVSAKNLGLTPKPARTSDGVRCLVVEFDEGDENSTTIATELKRASERNCLWYEDSEDEEE